MALLTDDAVLTKERAERAEMKKRSVQQRMAELQKMKAERMQAGQVSFTAAAEKRVSCSVVAFPMLPSWILSFLS